jgi:hypothetical protein
MDHSLLDRLLKPRELYFCWTLKTIESRNSIIRAQNPAPGQGRWMKYCGIITRYNSLWRTTECGSEHQLALVHTSWCSEEPTENKFSQATVGVLKHWLVPGTVWRLYESATCGGNNNIFYKFGEEKYVLFTTELFAYRNLGTTYVDWSGKNYLVVSFPGTRVCVCVCVCVCACVRGLTKILCNSTSIWRNSRRDFMMRHKLICHIFVISDTLRVMGLCISWPVFIKTQFRIIVRI